MRNTDARIIALEQAHKPSGLAVLFTEKVGNAMSVDARGTRYLQSDDEDENSFEDRLRLALGQPVLLVSFVDGRL